MKIGMTNVCHLGGGFAAWKEAEMPIELIKVKVEPDEEE